MAFYIDTQVELVLAQHVTNTHLYLVALRFGEFFHGIFKTHQITNGNLILALLLVESNTMSIFASQMKWSFQLQPNQKELN